MSKTQSFNESYVNGASSAKKIVIKMLNDMSGVQSDIEDTDELGEYLLEVRTEFISKAVKELGQLDQYQQGVISALLEYIEINNDCCLSPDNWKPSAVSGKWQ